MLIFPTILSIICLKRIETESIKVMNQDMVKLDRFDRNNFARWEDKMKFLLTVLKIYYILDPNLQLIEDHVPTTNETQPNAEALERVNQERKRHEEDELLCRGHILNTLSDRLFDLFTGMKSAKEICDVLEFKYRAKEQGTNKYLIAKYFNFKFIDTKPLLEQVHELQVIIHKICALKIEIQETFHVGAIIAKLPSSWKYYGKKFLHKSEDITLEHIQKKHFRIEEESRLCDNKNFVQFLKWVNFVEGSSSQSKNRKLSVKRG
ncbi:UBN2_2 domain-containing protein [Cephalotus follicularis]|uniref:UBN2_2 domain-containing protein n=1 Tax=Cephalotus follicularis TaxID=3775 RepID=A0A1Q3AUN6_CEPFO|nr:UBN2_2 domain-containing protein [Cephalotus follicularis]